MPQVAAHNVAWRVLATADRNNVPARDQPANCYLGNLDQGGRFPNVNRAVDNGIFWNPVHGNHILTSQKSGASPSMRRRAMPTYSGLSSIRRASRCKRSATRPTVPAPPNGSRTVQGTIADSHLQVGCQPIVFDSGGSTMVPLDRVRPRSWVRSPLSITIAVRSVTLSCGAP